MAALTIQQMLKAEASAIQRGWTEETLLNLAGDHLGHAIGIHFSKPGTAIGFLGKGHNAGDTLVALRILRDNYGWRVSYLPGIPIDQCAPLVIQKAKQLGDNHAIDQLPAPPVAKHPLLLLDGLLGTGASGSLREPLARLAKEMAQLRSRWGARIAAIDLPSGIDADTGAPADNSVRADITFMIGNAKLGLLKPSAANHTGALAVVDVPPLTWEQDSPMELICPQTQSFAKGTRPFDFHKGKAGRVSILAGSMSYSGAAALAAIGALRAGAGLVTVHTPRDAIPLVASRCPAEVMVSGYGEIHEIDDGLADARVAGCGIGSLDDDGARQLFDWIASSDQPTILDADALNTVAKHHRLDLLKEHHVITPHPGEFKRLAPDLCQLPADEAASKFSQAYPPTLLLKGCRTVIAHREGPLMINSTGTPAMATGGHGDLLSGVIGARLAIGDPPNQAAAFAAWLCGRAAEIAMNTNPLCSEESLIPSDAASCLGAAYSDWRRATR